MSAIRSRKFPTLFEMDIFFKGGLIGGRDVVRGQGGIYGVPDLVGKTLIFIQPGATTVTFTAGVDAHTLNFQEIKLQIETAINTVRVEVFEGRLVLHEVTPANGITLNKTGTSMLLLGFSKDADPTGKLITPSGGAAPSFVQAYSCNETTHVVLTLE